MYTPIEIRNRRRFARNDIHKRQSEANFRQLGRTAFIEGIHKKDCPYAYPDRADVANPLFIDAYAQWHKGWYAEERHQGFGERIEPRLLIARYRLAVIAELRRNYADDTEEADLIFEEVEAAEAALERAMKPLWRSG